VWWERRRGDDGTGYGRVDDGRPHGNDYGTSNHLAALVHGDDDGANHIDLHHCTDDADLDHDHHDDNARCVARRRARGAAGRLLP
jgi:hypothetical protein